VSGETPLRIVRLANFVTPRSGGLRTALRALGEGYVAAGHDVVLVVPGDRDCDVQTSAGRVITMRGPKVPWTGGYRILLGRRRLRAVLNELRPDRLEVSDRFTLRWTGRWARERGVPAVMVSHESLYGLFRLFRVPERSARWAAGQLNERSARAYDDIVCTTEWAGQDFNRSGVGVRYVRLGVDLNAFHPQRYDAQLRRRYATAGQVLIVHCGRLSTEKRPELSLATLEVLRAQGVDAVLVVTGDGPLRARLMRGTAGLPVRFLGFISDRARLSALLATADVVLAPGPIETFGLAALEALASGTPVVVDAGSALPEVVGAEAGACVRGDPAAFAAGVVDILSRSAVHRRRLARRRAEQFDWPTAVAGFLAVHSAGPHVADPHARRPVVNTG
jgi:alpha-1,6-mannosyltransferase